VAFRPDGKTLASGGYDGTVRCGTPPPTTPLGEPLKAQGQVYGVAFSPDGKTLASAGANGSARPFGGDGTVRLWDAIGTRFCGATAGPPSRLECAEGSGIASPRRSGGSSRQRSDTRKPALRSKNRAFVLHALLAETRPPATRPSSWSEDARASTTTERRTVLRRAPDGIRPPRVCRRFFVQRVRDEVCGARPDDRAGIGVNRNLAEALRVRA
jgi:WD domain, G-beta repeat